MTIKELCQESHRIAREHGWWDNPRPIPEVLCLIHSEVSEALEAFRVGNIETEQVLDGNGKPKPEGLYVELVDVIIRIADTCEEAGVDLEEVLKMKMDYNETRDYRHGGKAI